MWNIDPIQIQAILYMHTNLYRTYTQSGAGRGDHGRRERRKESE
jgi:hypothetical protein